MYQHLLVPHDGTPLSFATVEQAVAYAKAVGARLTFFHARPDVAASSEGALLHAMSPQDFAEAAAGNARALLARAESAARAAQVPCASLLTTSDRPSEAILEAAGSAGCDLIFMASHGRRGLKGVLLGSVTRKVMEGARLPVLVASVESNQPRLSDEQKALSILRDEHRSLAAVLHALLARVDDPSGSPDLALLRAMVFYIEQFPERLHHPKEDAYLFQRLRARTTDCNALLDELEQQHVAGAKQFAAMRATLNAGDMPAFSQQVREFAKQQWHHMSTEEKLVLPAASRFLTAEDWREIAQAFGSNGDPRFGTGESFETLASRLLEMAAHAPRGSADPGTNP
jgi:nucleotide-binding universal stress UspA family protein/hemerythrin-like domain-containing protein